MIGGQGLASHQGMDWCHRPGYPESMTRRPQSFKHHQNILGKEQGSQCLPPKFARHWSDPLHWSPHLEGCMSSHNEVGSLW